MSRGLICDKWHRYCIECGKRHHIHAIRRHDCCPNCSAENSMTRDRTKVK